MAVREEDYEAMAEAAFAAANDRYVRSAANDEHDGPQISNAAAPGLALLKAGKLISGGEEAFCLIRNLAPDRLIADVYSPVGPGCDVLVMLTEDVTLAGTAIWMDDTRMEVRFDKSVDLATLLPRLAKPLSGRRARMPRLKVDAWARLRVGARVFSVRLCDLSQGGARVRVQGLHSKAGEAVLTIQGLRAVQGVVRWCDGSEAGLSFNQPLGFVELVMWLARDRAAEDRDVPASMAAL